MSQLHFTLFLFLLSTLQNISVVNVNNPTELDYINPIFPTDGTGGTDAPDHYQVYAFSVDPNDQLPNGTHIPTSLIFNGFQLTDRDRGVDYVRVEIQSAYGIFSLQEDHVTLADFTSAFCSNDNDYKVCHSYVLTKHYPHVTNKHTLCVTHYFSI